MPEQMHSWRMVDPGDPLALTRSPLPEPGPGEVLLQVRACGLCHTDVGFLYGGVRPNAALPLTLGHEILGDVVATAEDTAPLAGRTFIVPAVLPCGDCALCAKGRGNVCRRQKMPGNDFHGGFASHFLTPARFLCPVPAGTRDVEDLAVVADAVATSYQAVVRAGVETGDMVIVVGAGGVGTFAAQTAKALGAHVAAIDIDARRLEAIGKYTDLPLDASTLDTKAIRKGVAAFEKEHGLPPHGRVILECSGAAAGQATAYALLNHDAVLAVVGFTLEKIPLRLANLMAFDATAFGNWGCLPDHFPEILRLIEGGDLEVHPYVKHYPMSRLNDLLREESHAQRPVLIPDFEE
ncbi:MAG: 6-hydroxycyclohex-1-ene-1-carbonyl-CoA dehydrogenase [Planctomycetota bacterium]|jgi:6-hydroxycyclohex-1-ene-1-carbonyl-CoA dehydrogenase